MAKLVSALHLALRDEVMNARQEFLVDPVVMGVEAAVSLDYVGGVEFFRYLDLAVATQAVLPASATPFERGVALGVAIALSSEVRRHPIADV